jgi:hypothetical protein
LQGLNLEQQEVAVYCRQHDCAQHTPPNTAGTSGSTAMLLLLAAQPASSLGWRTSTPSCCRAARTCCGFWVGRDAAWWPSLPVCDCLLYWLSECQQLLDALPVLDFLQFEFIILCLQEQQPLPLLKQELLGVA